MIELALLTADLALPAPAAPAVVGPRRTADPTPTYRFVASGDGVRFRCSFDRPRLHRCRSPFTQRLRRGGHVLRVQALDRAGRHSRVRRVVVRIVAPNPWHLRRIDVGGHPFSLAEAGGSIWVANFLTGKVQRIDPATNRVAASVPVGGEPYGLAVAPGSIWVGNNAAAEVARIDIASNRVVARVPAGDRPIGLTYANGSVSVGDFGDGAITRIDAATNAVTRRVVVAGEHEDLALDFGSLWVPNEEGTVTRLDPATLAVQATIAVGLDPDFVVTRDGFVWTSAYRDDVVSKIDPATGSVTTLPAARGAQGLAFDEHGLWLANYDDDRLRLLDPAGGRVLRRWALDAGPRDVLVAAGSIWVASSRSSTVTRLTYRP